MNIFETFLKSVLAKPITVYAQDGYELSITDIVVGNGVNFKMSLKDPDGYVIETSPATVSLDSVKLFMGFIQGSNGKSLNPTKDALKMLFDGAKDLFELALIGAAAKEKRKKDDGRVSEAS